MRVVRERLVASDSEVVTPGPRRRHHSGRAAEGGSPRIDACLRHALLGGVEGRLGGGLVAALGALSSRIELQSFLNFPPSRWLHPHQIHVLSGFLSE